jgi:hypothetical protein
MPGTTSWELKAKFTNLTVQARADYCYQPQAASADVDWDSAESPPNKRDQNESSVRSIRAGNAGFALKPAFDTLNGATLQSNQLPDLVSRSLLFVSFVSFR